MVSISFLPSARDDPYIILYHSSGFPFRSRVPLQALILNLASTSFTESDGGANSGRVMSIVAVQTEGL